MASYLHPFQPYEIEPYKSPIGLYGQALQVKDTRLNNSLSVIRSRYDSILNTPLTNEEGRAALYQNLDTAMKRLGEISVENVALPENMSQINGLFDDILKDDDLIYDMAWTRNHQTQLKKAEELQKKDPSLVAPENLDPLYEAQEKFRTSSKDARPSMSNFTPYYDYDKKMDEALDKIRADVDLIFSVSTNTVQGPDGNLHSVSTPSQYTVKQLKEYKISELVSKKLATDARALHQMSLTYNYNTKYGMYPAKAALDEISGEISTYNNLASALSTAISKGVTLDNKPLSQNEQLNYYERIAGIQEKVEQLNTLKDKISIDPRNSNEYFTFNKFIKQYTESKVAQRSFKEDSLVSDVPSLKPIVDYQLDVLKKGWDNKFKLEQDAAATKLKKEEALGVVPVPINDILTQLSANPDGIVVNTKDISALIDGTIDNDGDVWMNWTGDGTSIENTLIVAPASGVYTPEQQSVIQGNIVLGKMTSELNRLGITRRVEKIRGSAGGGISVWENEEISGGQLYTEFLNNPNSSDPRVRTIVEKYTPLMQKIGVNITDKGAVEQLKAQVNTKALEDAVKFGESVKINGKFQVVPNKDKNIVRSQSGQLYTVGKMIIPESKMELDGIELSDLREISRPWGPRVNAKPDEKSSGMNKYEPAYSVPVYIPITGDAARINDRLLNVQDYNNQWGKDAPEMRQRSKDAAGRLQEAMNRSASLQGVNLPIIGEPGKYDLDFNAIAQMNPADGLKSVTTFNKIITEISMRTGVPYNIAQQGVYEIFKNTPDALNRQIKLENLANNFETLGGTRDMPGFRTFATPEEGRAALENQLELYKTGKTRNPVNGNSTLLEAMSIYAPKSDGNNPGAYASFIAQKLGVTINTPISMIDTKAWADAITIMEGNDGRNNNPGNLRPTR